MKVSGQISAASKMLLKYSPVLDSSTRGSGVFDSNQEKPKNEVEQGQGECDSVNLGAMIESVKGMSTINAASNGC